MKCFKIFLLCITVLSFVLISANMLLAENKKIDESKIIGEWSDGAKKIEFFEDQTWTIERMKYHSGTNSEISGTWTILDDGRVKLKAKAFGTQITSLGKLRDRALKMSGKFESVYYKGPVAKCIQCEKEAMSIACAISDYYAIPSHTNLPDKEDLNVDVSNPYTISGEDPNVSITIQVEDSSGKCPQAYQEAYQEKNKSWEDGTYQLVMHW